MTRHRFGFQARRRPNLYAIRKRKRRRVAAVHISGLPRRPLLAEFAGDPCVGLGAVGGLHVGAVPIDLALISTPAAEPRNLRRVRFRDMKQLQIAVPCSTILQIVGLPHAFVYSLALPAAHRNARGATGKGSLCQCVNSRRISPAARHGQGRPLPVAHRFSRWEESVQADGTRQGCGSAASLTGRRYQSGPSPNP